VLVQLTRICFPEQMGMLSLTTLSKTRAGTRTGARIRVENQVKSGRLAAVALAILLITVTTACSSGSQAGSLQTSPAGGNGQPTSVKGQTAPAGAGPSPLTGLAAAAGRPVLAVKIDNVSPARPQTGLGKADVVYVEPVEGGLSRIMAIFSSTVPARVGPVRSARQSDLELLGQYGRPGLVYSGANRTVLSAIRSAISAGSVIDLSPGHAATAYGRSSSRPAPHNLYVDPRVLVTRAGLSDARDVGFRFGNVAAGEGTATATRSVRYGAARTSFTWSATKRRWLVSLDGRPDVTTDTGRLAASTVVIQYTKITASGLHDVLGNATPYTHSVGSGAALVLRNGVAISAHWSRTSAQSGTTFTTAAGAVVPFAPGQIWVVFAPAK
jgi:hypothetical protein